MKLSFKAVKPHPPQQKPNALPTSMNIRSLPDLKTPSLKGLGTKFRYKGAMEK